MTNQENPQDDIPELAWSWIAAPELQIPGEPLSPNGSAGKYNSFTYDQAQKAYIIPRRKSGPEKLCFTLDAIYRVHNIQFRAPTTSGELHCPPNQTNLQTIR